MVLTREFGETAASEVDRVSPGQVGPLLNCLRKALGHEFGNQFLAAQGLAVLLDQDCRATIGPDAAVLLDQLHGLLRRMSGLTAALNELVRSCGTSSGGPAAVEDVAREAAAEVKLLLPDRRIEYHFIQPLPVLNVSPLALRRVLADLFRHAARAGRPDRPMRIEVGSRARSGASELWLRHDGRSLAPREMESLFDPFGNAATEETPLGLFPVLHLVAGWGGTIRVESELGQGTCFTLRAPDPRAG